MKNKHNSLSGIDAIRQRALNGAGCDLNELNNTSMLRPRVNIEVGPVMSSGIDIEDIKAQWAKNNQR